jgi:hypothetical protein
MDLSYFYWFLFRVESEIFPDGETTFSSAVTGGNQYLKTNQIFFRKSPKIQGVAWIFWQKKLKTWVFLPPQPISVENKKNWIFGLF